MKVKLTRHRKSTKFGRVFCRFCKFAWYDKQERRMNCTVGDNPGPVDADRASCDCGILCADKEMAKRDEADIDSKWNL
jgi:hypothetical protein